MNIKIFHTVNEGLFFQNRETSLLIDGIHTGIEVGYSNMPKKLVADMKNQEGIFGNLNALVFTHFHPDHFNEKRVKYFLSQSKKTHLITPYLSKTLSFEYINERVNLIYLNHIKIFLIKTIHEGVQYEKDIHQMVAIKIKNETYIICGDAVLFESDAVLIQKFISEKITGIFINPYQLAQKEGHAFIHQLFPDRVFLYHRPFREDDCNNVKYIVKNVLRYYPDTLPKPEIISHMSWIN